MYLLDTNVLSELRKTQANQNIVDWVKSVKADTLYTSILVVGEIRRGIERLQKRDPRQATVYANWLESLKEDYAERILPIDIRVTETWGRMTSHDPLPIIDSLLAATAQVHQMTLVTRNISDVERTGVSLLNPFE